MDTPKPVVPLKRQVLHAIQAYGRFGTTHAQLEPYFPDDTAQAVRSAVNQLVRGGQVVRTGRHRKHFIAKQFTRSP